MKDYEQLVCYGKGIDSIAGDIHKGVEEAQQVYDKIMLCFPNLKGFMEASQNMARTEGYVTTWQGRRRHLPDMMLAPYTFELKDMRYFDPFFDSEQLGVISEYAKLCASYQKRLEAAKWAKEQRQIKEEALQNGIKIHDNTRFIIDATRQCVNCVDRQTEILTKNGWKTCDDLFVGQEVKSMNPITGKLEWTKIQKIHHYWGTYKMWHYADENLDICCTGNHRIPIKQTDDSEHFLTFANADGISGDTTFAIKNNEVVEVMLPEKGLENVETTNFVWCVTTGTGTWVARRNGKIYVTGNSRIQGSAADQTKIAARLVGEDDLMKQYKFKLNLFVHDEMLGEAPYYTARYAAERLSNRMVYAAKDLCVPSKCDVVAAECWYGKEIDLETLPDPLGLYKKKEETLV